MAIYSQAPGVLDVDVVQGDDIDLPFQVYINNDATVYDGGISDWNVSGWIITNTGVVINGAASILDSAQALFKIRYEDTITSALTPGIHSHVVTVSIGSNTRTLVIGYFEVKAREINENA